MVRNILAYVLVILELFSENIPFIPFKVCFHCTTAARVVGHVDNIQIHHMDCNGRNFNFIHGRMVFFWSHNS